MAGTIPRTSRRGTGVGYHPPVDAFALLVLILILAVIWRGPKTLPRLGAMLGRGMRQARQQLNETKDERGDGTPV
jgi:hypothetical protein